MAEDAWRLPQRDAEAVDAVAQVVGLHGVACALRLLHDLVIAPPAEELELLLVVEQVHLHWHLATRLLGIAALQPAALGHWALGNGRALGIGHWAMGNGQWAMGIWAFGH